MKNNDIKKLYNDEMQNCTPDMDALWDKIEQQLPEKETKPAAAPKKPFITMKRCMTAATVCAMLAVIIPTAIRNADYSKDAGTIYEETQTAANDNEQIIYNTAAEEDNFEESSPLNYENLRLAGSVSNEIRCTGEPNGDEYFVEEDVLVETQLFVDAIVDRVYSSDDGKCVYYELSVLDAYTDSGEDCGASITISSCSPYTMKQNAEYIIPLKYEDSSYLTVFDGVPQIEVTLDSGMVFYSGWRSLGEKAEDILYPQSSVDDFFYDRMKFSYSKDISLLIEAWERVKNE